MPRSCATAVLRQLITVADEISGQAFSPQGKETKQMLDEAESKIFAIAEQGARGAAGWPPCSRC
jgi:replicative DNA helicase